MKYCHLYANKDGGSQIEDKELASADFDFMPPAPPVRVSDAQPTEKLILMGVPANWAETESHPAPASQWVFILQGLVEFIASNGDSRLLGPGGILLAEDTTGKGHRTLIHGDDDVLLAVVKCDGST
tara:strand:+ start:156 stop:533 length:378 start_codon:yes stop_codon:yes gene_type:complete